MTVGALKMFLMRLDEDAELFVERDFSGEWAPIPVSEVIAEVSSDGYERLTIKVDH
jgi:hypothetical protein